MDNDNAITLLLAVSDEKDHFNVYKIILDYVVRLLRDKYQIDSDSLIVQHLGDIVVDQSEKIKAIISEIEAEHFPVIANTTHDNKETKNVFYLKQYEITDLVGIHKRTIISLCWEDL